MPKLKVFVASSSEAYWLAELICTAVNDDNIECVPWKHDMVFELSKGFLEGLTGVLEKTHAGIFIFWDDDELIIKGEHKKVPRSNVILECGMWIGRHGRDRAFVVVPESMAKLGITDFDGVGFAVCKIDENGKAKNLDDVVGKIKRAISTRIKIEYPSSSGFGENILAMDPVKLDAQKEYSLAARIPIGGNLRVHIEAPNSAEPWLIPMHQVDGWTFKAFKGLTKEQEFISVKEGFVQIGIRFPGFGFGKLHIYENRDTHPSVIKTIDWE